MTVMDEVTCTVMMDMVKDGEGGSSFTKRRKRRGVAASASSVELGSPLAEVRPRLTRLPLLSCVVLTVRNKHKLNMGRREAQSTMTPKVDAESLFTWMSTLPNYAHEDRNACENHTRLELSR